MSTKFALPKFPAAPERYDAEGERRFRALLDQSLQGVFLAVNELTNVVRVRSPAQIAHGTYTPTLTNTTNLDASTAYECQWLRVGSVVTVSGKVDVDPTAGAATSLGISLPVASNFGATKDCGGVGSTAGQSASIIGDAANNRASVNWTAVDTTNRSMHFTFTYLVI